MIRRLAFSGVCNACCNLRRHCALQLAKEWLGTFTRVLSFRNRRLLESSFSLTYFAGLDSAAALKVMCRLKAMCASGHHTVLASMHQPRAAMWDLVDMVR